MRRILASVLVLLATAGAAFAQEQKPVELEPVAGLQPVDKTTQTEDVQFKNDGDDRMTVPVLVSGAGPYQFLVDTGADRTAVSIDVANRLQLARKGSVVVHTVAGTSTIETAKVPTLQWQNRQISAINAALLERDHMGADGILGTDSLASQRVMFDFKAQTMSVVPSSTPDFRSEPGTIVVKARRRSGRLLFTDATANDRRVTVVIDTGSAISIGNDALRRQLRGNGRLTGNEQVELTAVTGEKLMGDYMFVRELKLGGVTLSNLAIIFADAHTFTQLGLDDRPSMLLGMNAIRAFKKVSIDFANRKFRVILPEHSQLDVRMASAGRSRQFTR